ncbi:MAG: hypothetical protein Q9207_006646 [Kuettlingeria erythrocarpa]
MTIRLMSLFPGSFDDEISVSLDTTVLREDRIPKYEALSYAWGSTEDPVNISVTNHSPPRMLENGKRTLNTGQAVDGRLDVTQNLAVALRHLRSEAMKRVLWIDAICVDQQNLEERGHQVQRMADIYRNAKQVIAWLGPEGENSALAMETLGSLASKIELDWDTFAVVPGSDLADRGIALPYDDETWASVQSLLSRAWYRRLWIRQEILLARAASLQCGYEAIDWRSFRKAMACICRNLLLPSNLEQILVAHILNFVASEESWSSLDNLLYDTQACECSDPRDRIYALLNILHPADSAAGLQPDYRQTPHKTFQDVVLRALGHEGKLDLLAYCEWNPDLIEKPYWVPDFSKWRISNRLVDARCCYGSKAEAKCAANGILKAIGMCAAEISGIEEVTLVTLADKTWASKNQSAVQRLMERVDLDVPYIDGNRTMDALCCTLCADLFADSFIPARPGFPDRVTTLQYLRRLSQIPLDKIQPHRTYLSYVWKYVKGRHFFTTKQGYIGLLPKAGKMGDQVCVVLGCQIPLLLRRMESGNMAVIGECYIHGLMNGEALLGTLPLKCRPSEILVAKFGYQRGFVDQETGDCVFEDPRLGALPPGWRREDPGAAADWDNWFVNVETGERLEWPMDPRMTADALRARGVPLQKFLLE